VGPCPVSEAKIAAMRARVAAWTAPGQPGHAVLYGSGSGDKQPGLRICLLDGFLLYAAEMGAAMAQLDVRMFLLVSRASATRRREARDGYVTLEGFWADPPGYVDKIVWPNYAEAHAWLFVGGDVEGKLDERALREKGILAQTGRGLDVDMETTFEWTVETLMRELERIGLNQ
jgi:nicotinamide/nicotinate riboside kinase